jgi:hypothetical protein
LAPSFFKKYIYMEKKIACCGIDCANCPVYQASKNNDDDLRIRIAEDWKVRYNNPDIQPGMINCCGCMETGLLNKRCEYCNIRNCAVQKNYHTCAECQKLESCETVRKVFTYVPEALPNLKSLQ